MTLNEFYCKLSELIEKYLNVMRIRPLDIFDDEGSEDEHVSGVRINPAKTKKKHVLNANKTIFFSNNNTRVAFRRPLNMCVLGVFSQLSSNVFFGMVIVVSTAFRSLFVTGMKLKKLDDLSFTFIATSNPF